MDWRAHAACLNEDPELFFPVGSSRAALARTKQAKSVCEQCTVRTTCLQWAIDTRQETGVWGGTSEDERRTMFTIAALPLAS